MKKIFFIVLIIMVTAGYTSSSEYPVCFWKKEVSIDPMTDEKTISMATIAMENHYNCRNQKIEGDTFYRIRKLTVLNKFILTVGTTDFTMDYNSSLIIRIDNNEAVSLFSLEGDRNTMVGILTLDHIEQMKKGYILRTALTTGRGARVVRVVSLMGFTKVFNATFK